MLNQSIKPNQIVLVIDGPIGYELQSVINRYLEYLDVVTLKKNHGLGYALSIGLQYCKNSYVARMDTDDIAVNNRMQQQMEFLDNQKNISVVGGYISEFEKSPNERKQFIRKVPKKPLEVKKFAKKRNPMNHVTVFFRKEDVLSSGNYIPFQGFEDYYLWIRMLSKGFNFANIPKTMVYVRGGEDMVIRRQGKEYFFKDFKFQNYLYKSNFINIFDYVSNFFSHCLVRLLPVNILSKLYLLFARH